MSQALQGIPVTPPLRAAKKIIGIDRDLYFAHIYDGTNNKLINTDLLLTANEDIWKVNSMNNMNIQFN